jgi:hypothetical protein
MCVPCTSTCHVVRLDAWVPEPANPEVQSAADTSCRRAAHIDMSALFVCHVR